LRVLAGRMNLLLVSGVAIIVTMIALAYLVPVITGIHPHRAHPAASFASPSWDHPFGADDSGLDIFTRVFYAPRVDFAIAALGVGLSLLLGVTLGLFAGSSRGLFGEVMLRL